MKEKIMDKRRVKLDELLKKDYIPFLAGRPKRDNPIGSDDLINLRIAFNTAKHLDDFLNMV